VYAAVVGTRFGFRCSEAFSNYFLNWTKFLCLFSEECNHHSGGGSFRG
jgi:hypothetical protein